MLVSLEEELEIETSLVDDVSELLSMMPDTSDPSMELCESWLFGSKDDDEHPEMIVKAVIKMP